MSATVKLTRQYVVGSAIFDTLTFRAPKLADYRAIGKVAEVQRGVVVTYDNAIWQYVDRLVEGVPSGALAELEIVDALAVEAEIVGFFTAANRQLRERESSSSGSAGDQSTSTD